MNKFLPLLFLFFTSFSCFSQSCGITQQITTADSILCQGDSTTLNFTVPLPITPADTVLPTPLVNNNGQDGNMFDVVATNTIRIRYFEGLIANTPNITTDYSIYYKVGSHVGFENNAAAWTLLVDSVYFNPNAPNTLTTIPYNLNIVIPAGQTYAFYLTNTAAATNNNRYYTGTATGNVLASNADFTILEGTGGAYPFGMYFNARPWVGIVHYDIPPVTYLWSNGETGSSIQVSPADTMLYTCVASLITCTVEDSITVAVNPLPQINIPASLSICAGDTATLDAGTDGDVYQWTTGETSQIAHFIDTDTVGVTVTNSGTGCSASDSSIVTLLAAPSLSVTGGIICLGDTADLAAISPTALTYEWLPGSVMDSTLSVSPTQTTDYTVTVEDANGCQASATAQVTVNELPTVNAMGGTICLGDTADITATSPTATSYEWQPGGFTGATEHVNPTQTTEFVVIVEDANGCQASDTTQVIVNQLPVVTLAPIGNLCVYNTAITLSQGSPAGGDYTGLAVTAGTASFDPAAAGLGTHTVTYIYSDANGCTDSASTAITVIECLSMDEAAGIVTNIFPNPASDQLTVELGKAESMKLFTVSGTLVSVIPAGKQTVTVEVSTLPNGLYYLQTQSGKTFRFVVSH